MSRLTNIITLLSFLRKQEFTLSWFWIPVFTGMTKENKMQKYFSDEILTGSGDAHISGRY